MPSIVRAAVVASQRDPRRARSRPPVRSPRSSPGARGHAGPTAAGSAGRPIDALTIDVAARPGRGSTDRAVAPCGRRGPISSGAPASSVNRAPETDRPDRSRAQREPCRPSCRSASRSWRGLGVGRRASVSSCRRYPGLSGPPAVGVVCQVDDIVDQLEAATKRRPARRDRPCPRSSNDGDPRASGVDGALYRDATTSAAASPML